MSDPPVLSPWTQFCLNTAHEDCCPVTKVTPLFERFNNIQSFLKDILLSLNSLADILRAISILWMCSLLMFNSCERITHIPHHGLPKPLSSRNKIPFLRRKMKVEGFFFVFFLNVESFFSLQQIGSKSPKEAQRQREMIWSFLVKAGHIIFPSSSFLSTLLQEVCLQKGNCTHGLLQPGKRDLNW